MLIGGFHSKLLNLNRGYLKYCENKNKVKGRLENIG